nr:hypothetical protein [Nocardioides convexus]
MPGYKSNPSFADLPASGDVDGAKAALAKCSAPKPVKIKFTYSGGTPTSDKQASALKATWDKAGFQTESGPAGGHLLLRDPEAGRRLRRHLGWLGC